jgi:hypothetical protein
MEPGVSHLGEGSACTARCSTCRCWWAPPTTEDVGPWAPPSSSVPIKTKAERTDHRGCLLKLLPFCRFQGARRPPCPDLTTLQHCPPGPWLMRSEAGRRSCSSTDEADSRRRSRRQILLRVCGLRSQNLFRLSAPTHPRTTAHSLGERHGPRRLTGGAPRCECSARWKEPRAHERIKKTSNREQRFAGVRGVSQGQRAGACD